MFILKRAFGWCEKVKGIDEYHLGDGFLKTLRLELIEKLATTALCIKRLLFKSNLGGTAEISSLALARDFLFNINRRQTKR